MRIKVINDGEFYELELDEKRDLLSVFSNGRLKTTVSTRFNAIDVDGSTVAVRGTVFTRPADAPSTDADFEAFVDCARRIQQKYGIESPPATADGAVSSRLFQVESAAGSSDQNSSSTNRQQRIRQLERSVTPNRGQVRSAKARQLSAIASFVQTLMWVVLAISLVGGLVIAFQPDDSCRDSLSSCGFTERFPLLPLGFGLAVAGSIQCLLVIMVAAYIQARADGDI